MKKVFVAEVGERPLVSIDKEAFVKTATEWGKLARLKKEWKANPTVQGLHLKLSF